MIGTVNLVELCRGCKSDVRKAERRLMVGESRSTRATHKIHAEFFLKHSEIADGGKQVICCHKLSVGAA
jgi:hypothetical protein